MRSKHRDTMGDGRDPEIESYILESVKWYLAQTSKQTGMMVDAGCNYGYAMELFDKMGWWVVGFDIEPQMDLARLKDRIFKSTLETLEDFVIVRNVIPDLIFFNHTLEHSKRPWEVMEQAVRVLPEDGEIFIAVPAPISVEYVTQAHYSIFNMTFLRFMLNELGLKMVALRSVALRDGFDEIQIIGRKERCSTAR